MFYIVYIAYYNKSANEVINKLFRKDLNDLFVFK